MIFVTVGSAEKGIEFDRLIKKMDAVAANLSEPVIMQIGSSTYLPKRAAEVFPYKPFHEILKYFHTARLVVGHCGSGTVLNAFRAGVPLIVVPRRKDLGEMDSDDHQFHLARKLESRRGVRVVYDIDTLEQEVRAMLDASFDRATLHCLESRERLLSVLRQFVNSVKL